MLAEASSLRLGDHGTLVVVARRHRGAFPQQREGNLTPPDM
jgi:hypothetical protein